MGICCVAQETQIGALYQPRGVGWEGRREGGSKGRRYMYQFSSVQLLSRVRLFATPRIAARQASLSITNSQNLPKLISTESVIPSNHLIFCHPLIFLPSIFPSIRSFQMSQFFTSGGQSIGVSASASVLPMNIHD